MTSASFRHRLLATVRVSNWWSSKAPPLLSVAYAVILRHHARPGDALPRLAAAVAALSLLAWYAHVVNDLADIDEDRRSGKANRMSTIPRPLGISLAVSLLVAGLALCAATLRPAPLAVIGANFALFALYSIPPISLKRRRWWGAFADAAGVHVLPTLFVAIALGGRWGVGDVALLLSALLWSFAAGLRGILVHQVMDGPADELVGLRTVGTTTSTASLRRLVFAVILPLEVAGLAIFVGLLLPTAPLVGAALLCFGILEWLKVRRGWTMALFEPDQYSREPYRPLVNNDVYELWLPNVLALQLAWTNAAFAILPVLQVLLFRANVLTRARQAIVVLREVSRLGLPAATRARGTWEPLRFVPVRDASAGNPTDVVLGASYWAINGVNVFALNLARGLRDSSYRPVILATELDTQLVSVHEALMPPPDDIPVQPLAVRPWESWGAHWGATIDYLESRTPCVYVPNADWRHSCVSPLLSNGVAIVGIVHSDDPLHYDHVARLGRYWNAIVAVSGTIAESTAQRFPELADRISTIPIGVRIPRRLARRTRTAGEPLRIIYHGALKQHQKRVLELPHVITALERLGVPATLTIAGGGADEQRLRSEAQALVERGRIHFAGAVPHDAMPALLQQHDAYVLMSDFEGMPNALLEAMGHGLVPVVARTASGSSEIVRDGENGLVARIGDVDAFAAHLATLYRDSERRDAMARASFASVQDSYRVEDMVHAYHDLFSRVLEESRRGGFNRPRGPMVPPPVTLGGETIFPVPLPVRARGVGDFASHGDWFEFLAHAPRATHASVPNAGRAHGTEQGEHDVEEPDLPDRAPSARSQLASPRERRHRATPRVIVAAPIWNRNGVNVTSQKLVRGLVGAGLDARLLLTEERTMLVNVDAPRLPRPTDIPVEDLAVGYTDGWGAHWGAMERYLTDHAPCVYLPTFDWRHSCVLPRITADVRTVAHVSDYDSSSVEHARRLAPFLDAIVVPDASTAVNLLRRASHLSDRIVVIPEGRPISDTLPLVERERAPGTVHLAISGASLAEQPLTLATLRAAVARRDLTPRISIVASADNPELTLSDLADGSLDGSVVLPWPIEPALFASTDVIVFAMRDGHIPGEAWVAMGAGCVPVVVTTGGLRGSPLLDGENCFLVAPNDYLAIADAVSSLARDEARRDKMRERAHDLAWRGTTRTNTMIDEYLDLFDRIAGGTALRVTRRSPQPMRPPPVAVAGVGILPVKLRHGVPGVGRFPTRKDYTDYRAAVGDHLDASGAPNEVPYTRRSTSNARR